MKISYLHALSIALLVYSGTCSAKESLPVGVALFPPFQYLEDQVLVGSDTEILTHILDDLGYKPDFYIRPWKRVLAEGELGKYALIFSLTKNKERATKFFFSDPISSVRDVFFKRKDRQIQWNTLDDVAHLIVSASESYNYSSSFMSASKNKIARMSWVFGDQPELEHLKRLQAGQVDIAICEVHVCLHLIRSNSGKFDQLDYIDKNIGPKRNFHAGIPKAWPNSKKLLEAFNQSLRELIKSGERDEILRKYSVLIKTD